MANHPLAIVKDKFGDKSKLVDAVEKFTKDDDLWVARMNKDKGLAHVSNAKLLRLHATFSEVKEKFGTRAKLVDAILELAKRAKDAGFKSRIEAYPVPRLYDLYKSLHKSANPSKKPATKKAPVKKAPAKKAPTKKAALSKTKKR